MKKSQSWLPYMAIVLLVVVVGFVGLISLPKSDSNIGGSAVNVVPTGAKADYFSLRGNTKTYDVGNTFDTDISMPLSDLGAIYGMSIEGYVDLWSEEAMAQVVLVTSSGEEKLVAEFYPLIFEDEQEDKFNICDETCLLDGVTPQQLKIYLKDATLQIDNMNYIDSEKDLGVDVRNKGIKNSASELKKAQDTEKIRKINSKLEEKNKHWFAGETSVSMLNYNEKKKFLKAKGIDGEETSFPAGFEFYVGGVIETDSLSSLTTTENAVAVEQDGYVKSFDWRNRHGMDWITPIKNQGACGSCWAFAATGATEAQANLFFNQKLDLDLSEQELVSCANAGDCGGGFPSTALKYITNTGIVDENAFPYSGTNSNCTFKSPNPSETIKIAGKVDIGYSTTPATEENFKRLIIQNGPLSSGLSDWSHAMTLVGWKVVEEGDYFYYRDLTLSRYFYTVPLGDNLIGKTVWIFKNSWGPSFGDGGYVYVQTRITNMGWSHSLLNPVQSLINTYDVNCADRDADGYYFWGLGTKPASCPPNSGDYPDGDDGDRTVGLIDPFGNPVNYLNNPTSADFSVSKRNPVVGEVITFYDKSMADTNSWLWTFEGGYPETSTEKNPTVKYNNPGIYDVSLRASNDIGGDTKTVSGYINVSKSVPTHCVSSGDVTEEYIKTVVFGTRTTSGSSSTGYYKRLYAASGTAGTEMLFTLSPAFKDGIAKDEVWRIWIDYNLDYIFDDKDELVFTSDLSSGDVSGSFILPGNLSVTPVMRISMKRGEAPLACEQFSRGQVMDTTISILTTTPKPIAKFTSDKSFIIPGESVSFNDLSTNSPVSWSWVFDGGEPSTSTSQNPLVKYNFPGIYDVSLTAKNANGQTTLTKEGYINVKSEAIPIADFSSDRNVATGIRDLVYFYDRSTNYPTAWLWEFEGVNDGVSTRQNPVVRYTNPGTYKVSLTVSNPQGSNSKIVDDYITIIKPEYCQLKGNAVDKGIKSTTFNSQTTSSGLSGSDGYQDLTNNLLHLESGTNTYFSLVPASTTNETITWKIWIDYNQDSDFDESGEIVHSVTDVAYGNYDKYFFISHVNTNITTRMRVAMKQSQTYWNLNPCGTIPEGEVEDYIVSIAPLTWGSIRVTSKPGGADVYIDGKYMGTTFDRSDEGFIWGDLTIGHIEKGSYNVMVKKAGYYDKSMTSSVLPGQTTSISLTLSPLPTPSTPPSALFSSDRQILYEGGTVSFSDLSTGSPTSWLWTFPGGLPSSSTARNPVVTYNTAGNYGVTLKASNSAGSDTESKTGFITVQKEIVGGNLYITSVPSGAKAYIGKINVGVTPIEVKNLVVGEYAVKVSQRGYNTYSTTAKVIAGQTTNINANLATKTGKK